MTFQLAGDRKFSGEHLLPWNNAWVWFLLGSEHTFLKILSPEFRDSPPNSSTRCQPCNQALDGIWSTRFWTQHYFLPVPRNQSLGSMCEYFCVPLKLSFSGKYSMCMKNIKVLQTEPSADSPSTDTLYCYI